MGSMTDKFDNIVGTDIHPGVNFIIPLHELGATNPKGYD